MQVLPQTDQYVGAGSQPHRRRRREQNAPAFLFFIASARSQPNRHCDHEAGATVDACRQAARARVEDRGERGADCQLATACSGSRPPHPELQRTSLWKWSLYTTAWHWIHSASGTKPFPPRFAREWSVSFRGSISSRKSQRHSFTASNTSVKRPSIRANKTSARISSATTSGATSTHKEEVSADPLAFIERVWGMARAEAERMRRA